MIIDFHTHTFPDNLAERAVSKLKAASHTKAFTDGTDKNILESMKHAGIDKSVILPVATNPDKVSHMNDISAEKNGKSALIRFGCMHPDCKDTRAELLRIKRAGLMGIKLHPVYQGVDFDDKRNLDILYYAEELGLITVTHAGLDIGFPGVLRCTPKMVKNAVNAVKPQKLVLAHMGGWRMWKEVRELLPDSGVYIDTSFSLGKMTQEEDYYSASELELMSEGEFMRTVRAFTPDKVLFGTDSPWGEQKENIKALRALPLTKEEQEKILGINAAKLLGIRTELFAAKY